ncbi:triphosphoribosyl-dephospho-CoA synthase CitG [Photobacterium sp. TY1-4]|uniref:triphosphoribosyl-dephospho-CoA synthase CitG n=1 Tax=Photobacterium sp. TY1-4 TaxID=2899122 RepID=UPI0021C1C529|nr:triphosphoribosyl-dephospho-CoA synthase CitG [Photobacterium sp. TY1-4]UXI02394.1 triphosphoribosyl-dephospho-CoA synthase CitG [Photobacterium sp. TY1-4]
MANTAVSLLVDPAGFRVETPQGKLPLINLFKLVGDLGFHAMMLEVHLTPKPGLVDLYSCGAHTDMDIQAFIASAEAIHPYLDKFAYAGWQCAGQPAHTLLAALRPIGLEAEQAMFRATRGVNTHKGMIFSLGLVCGAVGWLRGKQIAFDAMHISQTIKQCCAHLVRDELRGNTGRQPATSGEQIFQQYGLSGARGEAASGLATVMTHALPCYEASIAEGFSTEQALWQTLLVLMAENPDTNVVSRGGLAGLQFVQAQAQALLAQGGGMYPGIEDALIAMDQRFIERNLSPGGSADLLAVTWLLAQLNEFNRKQA